MDNQLKDFTIKHIKESILVKQQILDDELLINKICQVSELIENAYKNNKKVLLAGNGGSAADAQHIAGEFVSRFYFDRPALSAIALTTDTSILTAIGNDYGYEDVFSRQVYANGVEGDIFIGISTSGNSANILKAIKACQEKKLKTIGFTGNNDCKMDNLCDYSIKVPSTSTPRIQESHIMIGHIICAIVEQNLFGKGS